jgi:hypothetical protein
VQGEDDLMMDADLVIVDHPSRVDEHWMHGMAEATGQSGTSPKSYVREIKGLLTKDYLELKDGSDDRLID